MAELERAPYFFPDVSQDKSKVAQLADGPTTLVGLDGRRGGAAGRFPGMVPTQFGALASANNQPSMFRGFEIQKGDIENKLRGFEVFDGKNLVLLYYDTEDKTITPPQIVRANFGGGSGSSNDTDMTTSGKYLYFANAGFSSTVDTDSLLDQTVLSVAATTAFKVDDTVMIGRGTAREEEKVIASIAADTSITFTLSLEFTHTAAQADVVEGGSLAQKPLVVWHDGTNWQSAVMGAQEEDDTTSFSPSGSASGGKLSDGTYHVTYRKTNPSRNTPSGLATVQTITIAGGGSAQKITGPSIPQDTEFSKVELYRSVSASATIAAGTLYLEGTLDISAGAQTAEWGLKHDGQLQRQETYRNRLDAVKFPPTTNRIMLYEGSMFMKKQGDTAGEDSFADIQWSPSHTFSPEVFPTSNIFRLKSQEGPVLQWLTTGDYLFGITPTAILRVQKSGTRIAISKNPVGTGPFSRSATAGFGNSLMMVTPRGMFFIDGASGKVDAVGAVARIITGTGSDGWLADIVEDSTNNLPNIHAAVDLALGAIFVVNNVKQEAIVFWLGTGRITMLRNFPWTLSTSISHPIQGGPQRAFFYGLKKLGDNVAAADQFAQLDRIYAANIEKPASTMLTMLGFDKNTAFDMTVNGTATAGAGVTMTDSAANWGPELDGATAHIWQGGADGTRVERTIIGFGTTQIDDDFDRPDNDSLGVDYTETEATLVTYGAAY